jgi:ATP-dependent DNA ligase
VFKAGQEVDLRAKSGKSLARYFPEMVEAVRCADADNFVLEGELTVPALCSMAARERTTGRR